MITNEKQYRSTRAMLDKLTASANAPAAAGVDPIFARIADSAIASQVAELEELVTDYERLKSGTVKEFRAATLSDLPDSLVRARIARGMSQKDLADFLGMKEQQVQRYEAERYRSASLERLVEISDALGVAIENRASLVGDSRMESVDPVAWRSFPIAEMYKRGWFEDFAGTMAQARKSASELVPAFLRGANAQFAPLAFHRKSVRASGSVHESAIAAWEARVRRLAQINPPPVAFDRRRIDDVWIRGLVSLSLQPIGPALAVDYLRDAGIALIIERHLPGTLLDGAALYSLDGFGLVALTLRHDRLDNFWFTLLHEIGHLKLHIGADEAFAAIFDDTESPSDSDHESEADLFAQEALLPAAQWGLAVSRFSRTEQSVMIDAKRFGVGPAVIAGRVRREAGDYTLLRGLVGAGEVRHQFGL
ncbi:HTH-type transcriptional regulator/antitoxin HigA [Brevundimonas nasdae]|uniref:XRE family transcriptional regulator n=1 Tax=Brevundimonas nasdae TaxID=172043 RepID=UPI001911B15C|nr:XRE family transcriptional regulator [Brevundimonas nasdae]MBK6026767.1 ImmA/IrrE family metallo-endopeptidase [Brevundimonas nasdae]MDQ0453484.1 HTH-type transcriptional regulator/antitoxin HigA [Brevundimonas nasdae]